MSQDLRDDLTDIHGIGDAKADQITELVEQHSESEIPAEIDENIREAWDYYSDGQESYAGKFLRRAYNQLD